MAHELAAFLVEGYINNTRHHSTHGYLHLVGYPSILRFELAGDPGPALAGRAVRFRPPVEPDEARPAPRGLAPMMAGATGTMDLMATAAHPDRPTLSLEWFCQTGRLRIEIVDPLLMLEGGDPFPLLLPPTRPGGPPPAPVAVVTAELPEIEEVPDDEAMAAGARLIDLIDEIALRRSEEGGDDETEISDALTEQLELYFFGEHGDSVGELLQPRRLPNPEELDEARAEQVVKGLIAEMATLNLGIHLCPHADYRTVYRWLLDEIVPHTMVAPRTGNLEWVMWQSYGETCPLCQAEDEDAYGSAGSDEDLSAPGEPPDGS
jgi:hypothetical protein